MTRKPLDRRALFASGAAAALLAAAGVSAGPLPQRGGKLRLALSGASRSDDWLRGDGLFMQIARVGLVFETLTEVAADGTLRGELAVDWRSSEDARVWTFDLRPDVQFHDGAPLTADDVVFSLDALGAVEAVTANQVKITLDRPDAALPFALGKVGYVIRPRHNLQGGVGTGMYRVRHFAAGQQLLAERVEDHWKDGQAGWFDSVELVSIPSSEVRSQAVAEYLVDGADIADGRALRGFEDIALFDGHAVSRSIAMPSALGRGLFDDLRAPLRWWGA
ncbi:ABC transporter substrate-binding protein [Sulfitobacter donghicola]|uniref:Peptide ABC transporter substrate-binding protein n=1 Tax=Sulfitobacter donghicola DSW-25 = KCTC 12864 = JCM 14565 TaxID=1300350 RepID=A0A073IZ57_9RHOB|nr:ABC transporter substrate-binding protein [Sulfitobacter donghicola]KEJ90687.1 peptide ABC transporter substrate-binding protein [Sulfitobacter donghicola DSW-25 = KCTC 12864 = JCM 14565]KIN67939.1 ABC transporter, substrate-binding protein [Sulfitobacter donghicola DSW-25 = KCTC 12864 = JCM 14565]